MEIETTLWSENKKYFRAIFLEILNFYSLLSRTSIIMRTFRVKEHESS